MEKVRSDVDQIWNWKLPVQIPLNTQQSLRLVAFRLTNEQPCNEHCMLLCHA